MNNAETPAQAASRIIYEVREVASDLPYDARAKLVREIVKAVRDAVKFDATVGGAPQGRDWELDGLGAVGDAAEDYYHAALREKRA